MTSGARVRCRICDQSTVATDGRCEFCGSPLDPDGSGARADDERARRALDEVRRAPDKPRTEPPPEQHDGPETFGRLSLVLALAAYVSYASMFALTLLASRQRALRGASADVALLYADDAMLFIGVAAQIAGLVAFVASRDRRERPRARRIALLAHAPPLVCGGLMAAAFLLIGPV